MSKKNPYSKQWASDYKENDNQRKEIQKTIINLILCVPMVLVGISLVAEIVSSIFSSGEAFIKGNKILLLFRIGQLMIGLILIFGGWRKWKQAYQWGSRIYKNYDNAQEKRLKRTQEYQQTNENGDTKVGVGYDKWLAYQQDKERQHVRQPFFSEKDQQSIKYWLIFFIGLILFNQIMSRVTKAKVVFPYFGILFGIVGLIVFFKIVIALTKRKNVINEQQSEKNAVFKELVVREELEKVFGESLDYRPAEGIEIAKVLQTDLFPETPQASSEDYLKACYKGHIFQQTDLKMWRVVQDENQGAYKKYTFSGRWLQLKLDQPVDAPLYFHSNNIRKKTSKRLAKKKLPVVTLGEPLFDDLFTLYTEDSAAVFHLLTPNLRERMVDFVQNPNGDWTKHSLLIHIDKQDLSIAIDGVRDSFEQALRLREDEVRLRDDIRLDIALITDLLDLFID